MQRIVRLTKSRSVGLVQAAAAAAALAGVLVGRSAYAVPAVVEVAENVEELVDARLARRLIRLELADVELPPTLGPAPKSVPQRASMQAEEVVFVRLLRSGETITVELWAQGQLSGERHLTASTNEQHQARRVALASAELARRLRELRVVERQRVLRQHLASAKADAAPSYVTKVNVGLSAALAGAWWADPSAMLLGPRLSLGSTAESGLGVALVASALGAADAAVVRSWTELAVRPGWVYRTSANTALHAGLQLGAGVVALAPSAQFEGSDLSRQTWNAKAAIDLRGEWLLSPRVSLIVSPELGWMMRDLEVTRGGAARDMGGFWLGVSLGACAYL